MILHVITGLSGGGAEAALMAFMSALPSDERAGHSVVSLTDEGVYGPKLRALGVDVTTLGMRRSVPSPKALWQLIGLIRRKSVHLVQGWLYHANLMTSVACLFSFSGKKHLWGIHNALGEMGREKRLTQGVIRLCATLSFLPSAIVYVAERAARQHEALGYQACKRHVIPNGYNLLRFVPDVTAKDALCAELNLDPATPLVGLNARWDWTKDHATFFHAFTQTDTAHAVLVGAEMTADNDALMLLVRAHGLEGRVHCLGFRSDIERVVAGWDVACLSSCTEAQPNAVGEAMACGVPVVATDVGDVDVMIGGTGLVVPPQNPEALGAALNTLLAEAPSQRQLRGQLARARIESYYSLEGMVEKYRALYQTLSQK